MYFFLQRGKPNRYISYKNFKDDKIINAQSSCFLRFYHKIQNIMQKENVRWNVFNAVVDREVEIIETASDKAIIDNAVRRYNILLEAHKAHRKLYNDSLDKLMEERRMSLHLFERYSNILRANMLMYERQMSNNTIQVSCSTFTEWFNFHHSVKVER